MSHSPAVPTEAQKRVALLTLHRVKNYGSVLQTLASQQMILDLGYDVEVTDYWRPDLTDSIDEIAARMGWGTNPLRRITYRIFWGRWAARNRAVFNGFIERELRLSEASYGRFEELRSNPPQADIYVVGSDQVWNSDYNIGGSEPFFLVHAPESAPRVAFSSSFGKTELSPTEVELIESELPKFSAVSVRESSAVGILREHGIGAHAVADPTLAVSPALWSRIAHARPRTENYVLVYQLNVASEFERVLGAITSTLGTPEKRIALKTRSRNSRRRVVQPTVNEFVSLFRDAHHVVTDSFHGTVFSIIFNRPFSVVLPPKYGERLRSILSYAGLENRIIAPGQKPTDADIDWGMVNERMDSYRSRTRDFLVGALRDATNARAQEEPRSDAQ